MVVVLIDERTTTTPSLITPPHHTITPLLTHTPQKTGKKKPAPKGGAKPKPKAPPAAAAKGGFGAKPVVKGKGAGPRGLVGAKKGKSKFVPNRK